MPSVLAFFFMSNPKSLGDCFTFYVFYWAWLGSNDINFKGRLSTKKKEHLLSASNIPASIDIIFDAKRNQSIAAAKLSFEIRITKTVVCTTVSKGSYDLTTVSMSVSQ